MYPSFRAEQISYPFPGKQADPGAKRLFHRNELKDLYGEYVHDANIHTAYGFCNLTKQLHALLLVWGDFEVRNLQFSAKKSYSFLLHSPMVTEIKNWWAMPSPSRSRAAEVTFIQWIYSRAWCAPKGLWLWRVQHSECTQSQWEAGYRATGMSHRSYKEKWPWQNVSTLTLCSNMS